MGFRHPVTGVTDIKPLALPFQGGENDKIVGKSPQNLIFMCTLYMCFCFYSRKGGPK